VLTWRKGPAENIDPALQVTANTYVVGTRLRAGCAIGLALRAMWVDGAERPDGSTRPRTRPATSKPSPAVWLEEQVATPRCPPHTSAQTASARQQDPGGHSQVSDRLAKPKDQQPPPR
jgi:hypothetical protein